MGRKASNKIFKKLDKRYIIRKIKRNPKVSAPKLVTVVWTWDLGKSSSAETVRHVLRDHDLNDPVARKNLFISTTNSESRLIFGRDPINKDPTF